MTKGWKIALTVIAVLAILGLAGILGALAGFPWNIPIGFIIGFVGAQVLLHTLWADELYGGW